MFYAQFVLAKKGPLARIWLAAHWDKKLTKAHVFETNIEKSVDGILQPKVKMALRTSGHLLLGVVRIYSRKAKYLLADCNEAFVKIKMAFRPGMVDLPEDNREAAVNAITLPEVFHDFDTTMPELNDVDIEAQFSLNQSRAEEITMREDYRHASALDQEDGFDLNFDEEASELIRNHAYDQDANILFDDGPLGRVCDPNQFTSSSNMMNRMEIDADDINNTFTGNLNADPPALFGELKLFDDTPIGADINEPPPPPRPPSVPAPAPESDDDDHFGGPASPMGHPSSDDGSRPGTPAVPEELQSAQSGIPQQAPVTEPVEDIPAHMDEHVPTPQPPEQPADIQDHTQLLHNEEESFALAPIDASVVRGITKTKRKRKLIVDEVKNISGEEMKAQLSDTSDIVITLDLAPPTKRLMHWKESGGVEKLFALPGRMLPARVLFKMYQRHLTSRAAPNEIGNRVDENERDQEQEQQQQLQLDVPPTPAPAAPEISTKRGRKRKTLEPIEENIQQEIIEPPSVPPTIQEDVFLKPPETPLQPPMTPLQPPMTPLQQPMTPLQQPMTPLQPPMSVPDLSIPPESPYRAAPPTPLHEIQHLQDIPQQPLIDQTHSFTDNVPSFTGMPDHPVMTPQPSLFMENMGYQDNLMEPPLVEQPPHDPNMMANMGYDENHPPATTPGGQTPFHEGGHEDYDMPVSVGPQDEQATDETFEQFEERVLNKRAAIMYRLVKSRMDRSDTIYLSDLTHRNNKKQAAQKFYSILVLKKFKVLNIHQECSYGEISITKGPTFDNPTL